MGRWGGAVECWNVGIEPQNYRPTEPQPPNIPVPQYSNPPPTTPLMHPTKDGFFVSNDSSSSLPIAFYWSKIFQSGNKTVR